MKEMNKAFQNRKEKGDDNNVEEEDKVGNMFIMIVMGI